MSFFGEEGEVTTGLADLHNTSPLFRAFRPAEEELLFCGAKKRGYWVLLRRNKRDEGINEGMCCRLPARITFRPIVKSFLSF